MSNVQCKRLPEMCQKQPSGSKQKVSIPLCMQVHLRLQVGGVEQAVPLKEELPNRQTSLPSLPNLP